MSTASCGKKPADLLKQSTAASPQKADLLATAPEVALGPIVLQKSQVAGGRILRQNPKREAIADSYSLTRVTEVACEFNVRR
jgi:hypothetical protein